MYSISEAVIVTVEVGEKTTSVVLSAITVAGKNVLGKVSLSFWPRGYRCDVRGGSERLNIRRDPWNKDEGSAEIFNVGLSATTCISHANAREDFVDGISNAKTPFVYFVNSITGAQACNAGGANGDDGRKSQGRSQRKE